MSHAQARRGLVREALETLATLRNSGEVDPSGPDFAVLLAIGIDCRLARGDVREALALSDELAPFLEESGVVGAVAHFARGELSSALNEPDLAAVHFETAGVLLAESGEHSDLVPWRASAALDAVRLGRRHQALELAREQLIVAKGSPYATAQALRVMATAQSSPDRIAVLRQAREALSGVEARRLAAQIDTDLAGMLLLRHEADANAEALLLLRRSEAYAGRQGLLPLQARVRRFLERMGETPRRAQGEALAILTASERRVALLATDGLTNRQIAGQLAVTVKAVEWHLSHVYRKLELRSRAGLAEALGTSS